MVDKKMVEDLARMAEAFSQPIDFDQLIADGLLIQKGQSYYAPNIHALPDAVAQRIKEIKRTKNGTKVTFYKESEAAKRFAIQLGPKTE